MGVHIREPLIRAEWKTSRGPGSLFSRDLGWTAKGSRGKKNEKYQEREGEKETQAKIVNM